uniref:Thymidine kinase n=1 Tax=Oryzias sinensis TaxID=183150 RepID=A0A8C7WVG4_9TELE
MKFRVLELFSSRLSRNTMEAIPANSLSDVRAAALKACVIGIDEGQFFPDTVEFSEEMANLGKTVIVAALDATFQRKPFGNILSLVPLAESVVKLHAVCMQCYREAAYTKRIGVEKEVFLPLQLRCVKWCLLQVEVIGGADKYQAVCRTCYGGQEDKENTRRTPIRAGKEVEASLPRKQCPPVC